jgi:hypothetical protein
MREQMIETLRVYFSANVMKHKMNIEIMLKKPVEQEIAIIAEYEDKLEVLNKHFS